MSILYQVPSPKISFHLTAQSMRTLVLRVCVVMKRAVVTSPLPLLSLDSIKFHVVDVRMSKG